MTAQLPNLRYELKFLAATVPVAEVLAQVRRHPRLFREVYPPRTVNNIYLDSPGLRDYHAHVAGCNIRVKTRLRWYGPLRGAMAKPMLERKFKRGTLSGKATYPVSPLVYPEQTGPGGLAEALAQSACPPNLKCALQHLRPSLVNRYQRHYFLSADGRFRLTVDAGLEFHLPRESVAAPVRESPCVRTSIIELKYFPEHAEAASEVTTRLPYRLSRCSKYVLGIERLATVL